MACPYEARDVLVHIRNYDLVFYVRHSRRPARARARPDGRGILLLASSSRRNAAESKDALGVCRRNHVGINPLKRLGVGGSIG